MRVRRAVFLDRDGVLNANVGVTQVSVIGAGETGAADGGCAEGKRVDARDELPREGADATQ